MAMHGANLGLRLQLQSYLVQCTGEELGVCAWGFDAPAFPPPVPLITASL